MPYLADNSYLAIGVESAAGTAVIPTVFVPLVSESIKTVVNHTADRRIRGQNWKGNGLLRGNRMHEGEITVLLDPDTAGHVLNMAMLKGSTTGDADGYTHPFTVGAGDTYTFEIKKGLFAKRLFGVYVDEVRFSISDGQLQATLVIAALGQFSASTLGVATSGSVDEIVLGDEYDISPNRGLVSGDVLNVGGTDVTLDAAPDADGITVPVANISLTKSAGVTVYLKPLSVSNPTLQDPFYLGNLLAGFGADDTAAGTAAGDRATATPIYDLEITYKRNLFKQNGSNRLDPAQIAPQTPECQIRLSRLLENADQMQAFLDREKQAAVFNFFGKFIKSDFTTQEKLTFTFYNIKLIESEPPLEVGSLIKYVQDFEVLYDDGDAAAMIASLINRTAGSAY